MTQRPWAVALLVLVAAFLVDPTNAWAPPVEAPIEHVHTDNPESRPTDPSIGALRFEVDERQRQQYAREFDRALNRDNLDFGQLLTLFGRPYFDSDHKAAAEQEYAARLKIELARGPPDALRVRTLLELANRLTPRDSSTPDLAGAALPVVLERLKREKEVGYSRAPAVGAHIFFKRPIDKQFDPLVDFVSSHRLDRLLSKPVKPDNIVLLPFVYSFEGLQKLQTKKLRDSIASGGSLELLRKGELDEPLIEYFRALKGKVVVIVGHIERVAGEPAFEIRRTDGKSILLRLDFLRDAAANVGFNFIPLGCKTAEDLDVGAIGNIKDVTALEGFQQLISSADILTYRKMLNALSSEQLSLAIDVPNFNVQEDTIPIETVDSTRLGPGSVGTSGQPLTMTTFQENALVGNCYADHALSARGVTFTLWVASVAGTLDSLLRRWFMIYPIFVALTFVGCFVEAIILKHTWFEKREAIVLAILMVAIAGFFFPLFFGLMFVSPFLVFFGGITILVGAFYRDVSFFWTSSVARYIALIVFVPIWLSLIGLLVAEYFGLYQPNLC